MEQFGSSDKRTKPPPRALSAAVSVEAAPSKVVGDAPSVLRRFSSDMTWGKNVVPVPVPSFESSPGSTK